jgi:hypothetical protein
MTYVDVKCLHVSAPVKSVAKKLMIHTFTIWKLYLTEKREGYYDIFFNERAAPS